MIHDRQFIQTAIAIAERSQQGAALSRLPALPTFQWDLCLRQQRLLHRAQQQGWLLAARVCHRRYQAAREQMAHSLCPEGFADELQPTRPAEHLTARTAIGELVGLTEEFASVAVDLRRQTISVKTVPIELEEVALGPFEIILDWERLGTNGLSYHVVASQPNPAATDSEVTHPHVSSETLCEGEGQGVINAALKEGRLFDFFLLVQQVLLSYNPDSAYVALDEWQGMRCFDCGGIAAPDDRCDCSACETALCYDCARCCCDCEELQCYECMDSCWACEINCCRHCLRSCEDCEQSFCTSCVEEGTCDACREAKEEAASKETGKEEISETTKAEEAVAGSAASHHQAHLTLQPVRVEQVARLA
ncbi:MAG: hypothetical protein RH917_02995 [Lacipirellulaceae bacterium]